jgi:hypothetical protein
MCHMLLDAVISFRVRSTTIERHTRDNVLRARSDSLLMETRAVVRTIVSYSRQRRWVRMRSPVL